MSAHFSSLQKSFLYASKTLLGSAICWYGLSWCGIQNPLWSVITVLIVSDPDITTTITLARVRVINTIVGCAMGLLSLLVFGYSPLTALLTAAFTVLIITSAKFYPTNWRLAPVTVMILMDTGRQTVEHEQNIRYALMRAGEIGVGCAVALLLALLYTRLALRMHASDAEHSAD